MKTNSNKTWIISFSFAFFLLLFFVLASHPVSTYADEEQEVKLNVRNISIAYEKTFTLKVYNTSELQATTFQSSNESIATVSSTGLITGISDGTAVITVTIKEKSKPDISLYCDVLIGRPAISVTLDRTEVTLPVDKRITLKTLLLPSNTVETAKFFCEDSSIATVSSTGRIRAKKIGKTTVYAVLDNGKSVSCEVIVVEADPSQTLGDEKDLD